MIGPVTAYEVLTAFFLEAGFLGVEREHHDGSVLTTRTLAVGSIAPNVDADGCGDRTVKAVEPLVDAPEFHNLILDGLAGGYSVTDMLWGVRDGRWWPAD